MRWGKRSASGMAVEEKNGVRRCRIMGGCNEAAKCASGTKEMKREADGFIYERYNFPLKKA
jgi:hypothetical protein